MSSPLDEVCGVLNEFAQAIAQEKVIWAQLAKDNPPKGAIEYTLPEKPNSRHQKYKVRSSE